MQQRIHTKVSLQFKVRPVIERIAHGVRNGESPLPEFLFVAGASGNIFFIDAEGAHCTPLVMIASQPDAGEVFKLPVIGYFVGRQMAMRSEEHTSELQSRENLVCRL